MAHSRSALKRWRQSLQRRARNRSTKARTRTLLTKALFTVEGDAAAAEESVREAISSLDRAAQKGVIHKNAAARSKSRLLKRFNLATANAVAAAAAAAAASAEAPAKETPARRTRAPRAAKPAEEPKARRTRAAKPAEEPKTPRPRTRRTSS